MLLRHPTFARIACQPRRSRDAIYVFVLVAVATVLLAIGCAPGEEPAQHSTVERNLVRDFPPRTDGGLVNVVVEIPTGTNAKWEVKKPAGTLEWEERDGQPRVVDYLAYPGNYGMVPRTLSPEALGGDGDPLDVLVLGPALERGAVVAVRLIGVLILLDGGEHDDKLIAVQPGAPLGHVSSLEELDAQYRGISEIVKLWFSNYKGPGEMEAKGYGDAARATEILDLAIDAYQAAETARSQR